MPDQDTIAAAVDLLTNWSLSAQRPRLLRNLPSIKFDDWWLYPYFDHPGAVAVTYEKGTQANYERGWHICVVHVVSYEEENRVILNDKKEMFRSCLNFILVNDDLINNYLKKSKCTHLFPPQERT